MNSKIDPKNTWKKFIQEGTLDSTILSNDIMESWQLCRQYKVNPYSGLANRILAKEEIAQKIADNKLLIDLYKKYIKRLHSFLKGWQYVAILTDKDGYILLKEGDSTIKKAAETIYFTEGAKWDEIEVGTNAIGLTKRLKKSTIVNGYEHFAKASQMWNCAAAPILDQEDKLIGVINISSTYLSMDLSYVLASVQLTAESISFDWKKQMQEDANILLYASERCSSKEDYIICKADKSICSLPKGFPSSYQSFIGTSVQHLEKELISLSDVHIPVLHEGRVIGYRIPIKRCPFIFKGVKGISMKSQKLLEEVEKVACTETTVHIYGETGTGKKLIAKTIHDNSFRAKRKYISLHCASLTEERLKEELLLGHKYETISLLNKEIGAYLKECTLFLEEIGELSSSMQIILLQLLQQKELAGGKKIRLITGSTIDIRLLAEQGKMNKDLFYRLYTYPLTITPLRERREDIEGIIEAYLFRQNWHPSWKKRFISIFMQGQWPGNIRELHNALERCKILYKDKKPSDSELYQLITTSENLAEASPYLFPLNYKEKMEIKRIKEALIKNNGRRENAARDLNISRATLYRKLKKYGIEKNL